MKLNVGCGTDYREGFVNIDGSNALARVDKIIDISSDSLLAHFEPSSVDFILANDIIEHHFHWEAVRILRQFFALLHTGGTVEIRVPDAEYIIKSWRLSLQTKLNLLFGGQDIPQGRDVEMDESRKKYPQYFCHKYGWTRTSMQQALALIGFTTVTSRRVGENFITLAVK
jgi:predicted SAM-dependent methyltransferase